MPLKELIEQYDQGVINGTIPKGEFAMEWVHDPARAYSKDFVEWLAFLYFEAKNTLELLEDELNENMMPMKKEFWFKNIDVSENERHPKLYQEIRKAVSRSRERELI